MAVVLLQSLIFLLHPLKPALAGLLAPSSRGRLCCRVGLTGRPYCHRWLGHPSTHPHLLLFSGNTSITPQPNQSQPSYSPQHGHPLLWLRRLWVVPFLGLTVVHCVDALGTAWSTNDSRRKRDVSRDPDSRDLRGPWPHGSKCHLITRQKWIPLTTGTHQLYLCTQGSASLLSEK